MILSHAGILRRARKKSFLPVCVKKSANQFWLVYCRENARKSRLGNQRGQKMSKFRKYLQLSDCQIVIAKYGDYASKTQVLKLSKSMFDNVKHTV